MIPVHAEVLAFDDGMQGIHTLLQLIVDEQVVVLLHTLGLLPARARRLSITSCVSVPLPVRRFFSSSILGGVTNTRSASGIFFLIFIAPGSQSPGSHFSLLKLLLHIRAGGAVIILYVAGIFQKRILPDQLFKRFFALEEICLSFFLPGRGALVVAEMDSA